MAHVLILKDGSRHVALGILDLVDLVDSYMGLDMKTAIEEEFNEAELAHYDDDAYIKDLEQENAGLRGHYRQVMGELEEASKQLAAEIRKKDPDRRAISDLAGRIGIITGRELK